MFFNCFKIFLTIFISNRSNFKPFSTFAPLKGFGWPAYKLILPVNMRLLQTAKPTLVSF